MKSKPLIIPPIYFLINLLSICFIFLLMPQEKPLYFLVRLLGVIPGLGGFIIATWPLWIFSQNDTAHDWEKTRVIISSGPYKWSRNPMYLGMILMLLGAAILSGDYFSFLFPFFMFFILQFQIIPWEEEKLFLEQGENYLGYKNKVRRWI